MKYSAIAIDLTQQYGHEQLKSSAVFLQHSLINAEDLFTGHGGMDLS